MKQLYIKKDLIVATWLFIVCFAVIIMIFIGGLTRLTDSGLSITEWKPLSGILPPTSAQEWQSEFDKYKEYPEYIKRKSGMDISEFKFIYLLEFIHRIAGRITGLLYTLPLIYFLIRGHIKSRDVSGYIMIMLLFLGQGVIGWYMVSSGLINSPHVSHYRLALHLLLAIIIYSLLSWQFMRNYCDIILISYDDRLRIIIRWLIASIIILFYQIAFGAFVAGLDAGLVYNNFPYMGDGFIPSEIKISDISLNSFSNPVFVQLIHRLNAYILTFVIFITCIYLRSISNVKLTRCAFFIMIATLVQFSLGVLTLIYAVHISFALLHQLGAVLLLTTLLRALFLVKNS